MLIMTGKILSIESKEIINSNNNESFNKILLVVVKQMKGVKRNICFESYGKIAKDILNFNIGERVRIYFTIDSICNNGRWYHTLKVVEVEKEVKKQKLENINQINLINYDTIEKSFE